MLNDAESIRFKWECPEDHDIIYSKLQLNGTFAYIRTAMEFYLGTDQSVKLVSEPTNLYDRNAIQVVGYYRDYGIWRSGVLGYIPRYQAKEFTRKYYIQNLHPILRDMWWGGYVKDTIYITIAITHPKDAELKPVKRRKYKQRRVKKEVEVNKKLKILKFIVFSCKNYLYEPFEWLIKDCYRSIFKYESYQPSAFKLIRSISLISILIFLFIILLLRGK